MSRLGRGRPNRPLVRLPLRGSEYVFVLSDVVGVLDSILSVQALPRTYVDAVGLTDAESAVQALNRSYSDALGILDSAGRVASFSPSVVEVVGLTDAMSALQVVVRAMADSEGLLDDIQKDMARSLSDLIGLPDDPFRVASFTRDNNDTISMSDAMEAAAVIMAAVVESESLVDDWQRDLAHIIIDVLGATDALAGTADFNRGVSDEIGTQDAAMTLLERILEADAVGITDSIRHVTWVYTAVLLAIRVAERRQVLRLLERTVSVDLEERGVDTTMNEGVGVRPRP